MAEIKLANGTEIKELRVFDGVKWVAKRGRIFDGVKWLDFIRPPLTFRDGFVTTAIDENVSSGQRTILLKDSTGFNVGDEVAISNGKISENVDVVGRNYINSSSIQAHGCEIFDTEETYEGIPVINLVVNNPNAYNNFGFRFFNVPINEESRYFAFSLYYKITKYAHDGGRSVAGYFTLKYEDGTTRRINISNPVSWTDSSNWGKWIRLENIFDLGEKKKVKEIVNAYFYVDLAQEGDILVTFPKFEIGNTATEWTPYLEDIYTDISNVISVTPIKNSYSLNTAKATIKPKGMTRQTRKTLVREPIGIGQRTILLKDSTGFNVGDEITITDGINSENVKVVGRNLHKNTSNEWTVEVRNEGNWYFQQGTDIELELGVTYTFSIIVDKISDDDVPINLLFGIGNKGGFNWDRGMWGNQSNIPFGVKITKTFTVTENDLSRGYKYFAWRLRNERLATTIRYKDVKLEKGSISTPWTPAPEDVYGATDNVVSITPTKNKYRNNSLVARTNALIENKLIHSTHKTYSVQ